MRAKRFWTLLLYVFLMGFLFPVSAFAGEYPLWVGGVQVTDSNKGDITAAINAAGGTASGTAAFNPETSTLTLAGFRYSGAGYEFLSNKYAALYYGSGDDLIIRFSGGNRLERTGSAAGSSYGMYFKGMHSGNTPTVTIQGSEGDSLSVKGGVAAEDFSRAIVVLYADLVFSGGEVNAAAEEGKNHSHGISVEHGQLTVSDGTLNASGGTATSYDSNGIRCNHGTINIAGGTLTATGGDGNHNSFGIYGAHNPTISVTSGMLVAQGKSQAIKDAPLSLGDGMMAQASTSLDGKTPVTYAAADNDSYKWIKAEKMPEYTVTVEGGTAGVTTAKAGDTVTITADEPEEGMSWVQWSLQDGIDFAQTDGFTTTFTMPARDVTVHAVFKEITPKELDDQVYTGEAFTPTFGLFGLTLNGVDAVFPNYYDLSYEDNVNVGEAKVTVTMKAPYKGTKTVTFQILPADLHNVAVSEIPDQEYTGKEIKPEPTVIWNGRTLVKDKDYTLSYKDNVHAGDASVIVTGKGNFDSKTAATDTFSIVSAPLTVTALPQTYTYNGKIQGEGDTAYEDPAELAEKVSVDGLQGDDILTGVVLDGQGQAVGGYSLVASNASIGDHTEDYDILYVPGTLTIEPARATITVNSASKVRGGNDPTFTGTVEGLVKEGDLGNVTFVREGDDEAAGTYKGVLTAKYTDNKNYDVTVNNGDFTIRESFMVRWLNGDGSVLQEKTYAEGENVPEYDGKPPVKEADQQYTYQFTGWDDGTREGTVTTYQPLFKETMKPTPESEPEPDPQPTPEPDPQPVPVPVSTKKPILTAKASASGKKVTLSWNKIKDADRYAVFFSRCNGGGKKYKPQQIKNVKANKLKYTVKGLTKGRCYKFRIVAQKKVKGKYKTIVKSTLNHFIAGNESGKQTVPKSLKLNKSKITLKVKKTFRLKGTVKLFDSKKRLLAHAPKLRFVSNDTSVATVSSKGKIKAKRKGKCTIYVQTINGISKKCRVTVK